MEEKHLNRRELMYLSALLDMGNMWGFPDPFGETKEDEIAEYILQVQESLREKGCLVQEDELLPEKDLLERLLVCRGSEKVFILSSDKLEKSGLQLRFFVRGEMVIRYECGEEAVLSYCDEEWLRREISDFFGEGTGNDDHSFLMTTASRLRRMGSLSRQHFLQELCVCGCEESLALLIVNGLQSRADFKSLLVYSRREQREVLENKLVILEFAEGRLLVTAEGGGGERICLTGLGPEKLRRELTAILGQSREAVI